MFLRSGTYGGYVGLWDCSVGPMGFPYIYGTAVWGLWDSHGFMGLRCGSYGIPMYLWDCGLRPMGKLWGCAAAVPYIKGAISPALIETSAYTNEGL